MPRGKLSKASRAHNRHSGANRLAPSVLHQQKGKKYNKKHLEENFNKLSKYITHDGISYMVIYQLIQDIPVIQQIIKNQNCVTFKDLENCSIKDIGIRNGVSRILYSEYIKT
jgi:hypothetical protein